MFFLCLREPIWNTSERSHRIVKKRNRIRLNSVINVYNRNGVRLTPRMTKRTIRPVGTSNK